MSRIGEALLGRWPGSKIVIWSAVLGVVGVLPLLLYIALGPANGNPIGLGLLAVVAVPAAGIGIAAGLIKMLVHRLTRRED